MISNNPKINLHLHLYHNHLKSNSIILNFIIFKLIKFKFKLINIIRNHGKKK